MEFIKRMEQRGVGLRNGSSRALDMKARQRGHARAMPVMTTAWVSLVIVGLERGMRRIVEE